MGSGLPRRDSMMARRPSLSALPYKNDGDDWSVSGAPVRRLYLVFAILFALLSLAGATGYRAYPHPPNDFFAFNSFARFVSEHPPALIYDQDLVRRFQDLPHQKLFAFMYHPGMLLLLWPLAHLPYDVGYVLWVGGGLAACSIVVAGSWDGRWLGLLVVLAPSTLWTALCGQSSLLEAALLLSGMLLSPRRPILAGILIGLASYKPQLGILVPVALVAAGHWRTILAASCAVACIILASSVAFGISIWPAWFHHLPSIIAVRSNNSREWAPLLSTVGSNLMMLGVSRRAADWAQLGACIGAALCVWRCFRSGVPGPYESNIGRLQVAALCAATFLATPFAFCYDLPLFTGAVLLFAGERRSAGGTFLFREVFAILVGLLLPCFVLAGWLQSCGSIVVLIVLCTILRHVKLLRFAHDRTTHTDISDGVLPTG